MEAMFPSHANEIAAIATAAVERREVYEAAVGGVVGDPQGEVV